MSTKKPELFDDTMNKMLPNQTFPRNVERRIGRQEISIDDNATFRAIDQPAVLNEENKVLPNQNPPNKDGRQDETTDNKAASRADQPILSKVENNALRQDLGQDKTIDDEANSSAEQLIISKKDKVFPNQNSQNNDQGKEKRMDNKAASSANDHPYIRKENEKVLPNHSQPTKDGGQDKMINNEAASSAEQPIIYNAKNDVLPDKNHSQNSARQNKASNDNANPRRNPTSSEKTIAHILNRRRIYRVGEEMLVKIVARDAFSRPKTTGGDFFTTQLTSTFPVKASTAGRITDYGNGTYLARFILGWPGLVSASVRLVHSSEAVNILQKSRSDKIRRFFSCLFHDPRTNSSEWTGCTFNQNEKADYSRNISAGAMNKGLPKCGLHLPEPASEGYWYNGKWYSLRCRVQQGFDREAAIRCLRNKTIYLQGDSTLRQWYSEIARTINTEDNPNNDKFLGAHLPPAARPLVADKSDRDRAKAEGSGAGVRASQRENNHRVLGVICPDTISVHPRTRQEMAVHRSRNSPCTGRTRRYYSPPPPGQNPPRSRDRVLLFPGPVASIPGALLFPFSGPHCPGYGDPPSRSRGFAARLPRNRFPRSRDTFRWDNTERFSSWKDKLPPVCLRDGVVMVSVVIAVRPERRAGQPGRPVSSELAGRFNTAPSPLDP
ncbi:Neurexophilin [Branchiostoma belcheri]|nr:Neurexophilin [Branchiostoma belcheri]